MQLFFFFVYLLDVLCPLLLFYLTHFQIRDFVKEVQNELSKPGFNSFGLGDCKAPKVLGDIVESISGAIFLDSGCVTASVWEVSLINATHQNFLDSYNVVRDGLGCLSWNIFVYISRSFSPC